MASSSSTAPSSDSPHPYGPTLLKSHFALSPTYLNLNHGSFGTAPLALTSSLRRHQDASETRPDPFIRYTYPLLLDESRSALAALLSVDPNTLVFLPNATTGINTVLRSLRFEKGDHILHFEFIYGACGRAVEYVCETTPAEKVVVAGVELPACDDDILMAFTRALEEVKEKGGRVKVAVFDTVVSLPGWRMPWEKLVDKCRELGVLSCVDGAHGVGLIPLRLGDVRPDFFCVELSQVLIPPPHHHHHHHHWTKGLTQVDGCLSHAAAPSSTSPWRINTSSPRSPPATATSPRPPPPPSVFRPCRTCRRPSQRARG